MKITKRQLIKIIKEAQWGNFTGGAAPLDEPMRDSGPVPKDQLRKMADIFMNDMGMSPDEVLSKPEFAEQGITDLKQIEESKMKITKRQLRRIIKEEKQKLIAENRVRKAARKALLNEEAHPYDASINDAVDAGMFSNSDAVEEVQDHLRSAGATDLVDEIDDMVQYGDDDIYDVLAMIPKAIKDKLPIG